MNAALLKAEGMAWLRYVRKLHYVATEVGRYNADILAASDHSCVEIETKVSRADLRADFRKPKHGVYALTPTAAKMVPNRFYFLVPAALRDEALKIIAEQAPRYGLLVYEDQREHRAMLGRRLVVAKAADWLHREPPKPKMLRALLLRMSSELATLTFKTAGLYDEVQAFFRERLEARSVALDAYITSIEFQDLTSDVGDASFNA